MHGIIHVFKAIFTNNFQDLFIPLGKTSSYKKHLSTKYTFHYVEDQRNFNLAQVIPI